MSKKDFEIIAKILGYTNINNYDEIEKLLKQTNSNFDAKRFWTRVLEHKTNQ